MAKKLEFFFLILICLFVMGVARAQTGTNLEKIKMPPGFTISLWSGKVPGARSLAIAPSGTVFVGTRTEGQVYAVITDAKGSAQRVVTVAKGLREPNGVAFRDGTLYVAEVSRVIRFPAIEEWIQKNEKGFPKFEVVRDDFPQKGHHGWKFIRFGPDGWLYVPVGAPCNVCEEKDSIFSALHRISVDGKKRELVASGVRNTVGFDFHPQTNDLWFTENGRDMMGDEIPGDELNRLTKQGQHFGFPYCHQGNLPDPEFGTNRKCSEFQAPIRILEAHVAALGMRFIKGPQFPAQYVGKILIAEHGSWNRSRKSGYRLMLVDPAAPAGPTYEIFAQGWLQNEKAWGRPVDLEFQKDGSLLISDDEAGAIYRIRSAGS